MPDYTLLARQVRALAETDPYFIPLLSNVSAVLMEELPDLNWAGFYLMRDGRLVLGPFQGKPACIHIEVGKGVCGTAVEKGCTLRVADVHQFPGHIACDCASNSEIVVPIWNDGKTAGVLDIDSPLTSRFSDADEQGLKGVVEALESVIIW